MDWGNRNLSFGNAGPGTSLPKTLQFQSVSRPRLPFLATLNFLDLSKLMNDPVHHDLTWPLASIKLPFHIPKFEGKTREDAH